MVVCSSHIPLIVDDAKDDDGFQRLIDGEENVEVLYAGVFIHLACFLRKAARASDTGR